jgi:two-component system, NarL family, sensor histidine kinase UhpB
VTGGLRISLFWRVFLANATILVAGLLVLMFTPVSVSARVTVSEAADLVAGVIVMLAVNLIVLRPLLRPLPRLVRHMQNVDVLQAGGRIPVESAAEIGALERSFNDMLARLEAERRESGSRAVRAQEEQRQRIARGLHDEVGQTMTGVLFQLKRLADSVPPEQRRELVEAQDAVRMSLDEVRRVARELRPEVLDHLGLRSALKSLASGFGRRTGIGVSLELARELPALEPEAEVTIYRVAQESLTNVARHSGARNVLVSLLSDAHARNGGGRSVVLRVVDDGCGFGDHVVEGGGIRGIRERALVARAALALKPAQTGGLEVRLEVPAREVG